MPRIKVRWLKQKNVYGLGVNLCDNRKWGFGWDVQIKLGVGWINFRIR